MKLETAIRNDGDSYTLLVNGEPMVERETFAIVDQVKWYVDNPHHYGFDEATEIAASIRMNFVARTWH
jgi:hypothetical protein